MGLHPLERANRRGDEIRQKVRDMKETAVLGDLVSKRRDVLDLHDRLADRKISPALFRMKLYKIWLQVQRMTDASRRNDLEMLEETRLLDLLDAIYQASTTLMEQVLPQPEASRHRHISISTDIDKIHIKYAWAGLGLPRNHEYTIVKTDQGFQSNMGKKIKVNFVRALQDALQMLQISGGLKTCISHTDDYPSIRLEISSTDLDKIVLYSSSNCLGNIPWNVIWHGDLYVQYGLNISKALTNLLHEIDPLAWKKEEITISAIIVSLGFSQWLPITSGPSGIEEILVLRGLLWS